MPANPNKLSRFWQELKRRKVVHVVTVYASAAFVVIELINNLAEPLNLPPNLLTIVVIVLALGFPLAIILSWLYDVSSEGVEKTRPIEELKEGEKTVVPNAWKIATIVSFVVIIGLLTFNIIGGTKSLKAGVIQSLLILPFDNFTGDDQLDYVAAGMHSALIGDMGQISALRVISKKTASVYKTKDMSLPEIANDLMVELTPGEELLLARSRTVDTEAYDSYLMGLYYLEDLNPESLNKAREYLNRAIEKNPDWAPLYSGLTTVWITLAQMGIEPPEIAGPKIFENLNKALELDPDNADSHFVSGMTAFLTQWDWGKAETAFLNALATNPSDASARVIYAQLLGCLQRNDEALTQGRLAIELDPLNPLVQVWYAAVLCGVGDFETALAYGEKITADDPRFIELLQKMNLPLPNS